MVRWTSGGRSSHGSFRAPERSRPPCAPCPRTGDAAQRPSAASKLASVPRPAPSPRSSQTGLCALPQLVAASACPSQSGRLRRYAWRGPARHAVLFHCLATVKQRASLSGVHPPPVQPLVALSKPTSLSARLLRRPGLPGSRASPEFPDRTAPRTGTANTGTEDAPAGTDDSAGNETTATAASTIKRQRHFQSHVAHPPTAQ